MKKNKFYLIFLLVITICFTACSQANRVSYNISQEADNFNVIRQLTVINCFTDTVLFQMTGRMSIKADTTDQQLEITVEDEKGHYKKHFVGIPDNVTYTVEDITDGDNDVNNYKYSLNFNPKMWLPVEIKTID